MNSQNLKRLSNAILYLSLALLGARAAAEDVSTLPQSGRAIFLEAFSKAKNEIRIEICVLEDPEILSGLQAALVRGVRVRALVDRGKYESLPTERDNLARFFTQNGGELHLSNPIFPRSFPKIILIDQTFFLLGSACLDETTFESYRDFIVDSKDLLALRDLKTLFENDWRYSAAPGTPALSYNPTPKSFSPNLAISPVNAADRVVSFIRSSRKKLDVYTELLGNPTLSSELIAAAQRGVAVRLIAPSEVNGGDVTTQTLQLATLTFLKTNGVNVHVSGPSFSSSQPYMHARAMIADQEQILIGSISLSPDSISFSREVSLQSRKRTWVFVLLQQFEEDFARHSLPFLSENQASALIK